MSLTYEGDTRLLSRTSITKSTGISGETNETFAIGSRAGVGRHRKVGTSGGIVLVELVTDVLSDSTSLYQKKFCIDSPSSRKWIKKKQCKEERKSAAQ
jgi:hypothetical protein